MTPLFPGKNCRFMYVLMGQGDGISLKTNSFIFLQDRMRGSLAKARVLYAPVEEIGREDRLLRACRIQLIYTRKERIIFFLSFSRFKLFLLLE